MRTFHRLFVAIAVVVGSLLTFTGHAEEPITLALDFPSDYQVFQREFELQPTVIVFSGHLSAIPEAKITSTETRLVGAGEGYEEWTSQTLWEHRDRLTRSGERLPEPPGEWYKIGRRLKLEDKEIIPGRHIASAIEAPPGGWYRLEVRVKAGEEIVAEAHIDHLGVGEIFIVAGQSNAANHGEERLQTQTGRVSAYDGETWALANDPQPGASGEGGSFIPAFGDALVEQFDVPIGIIPIAVGATSVREWLPQGIPFPNPPTITSNVSELPSGEWQSTGNLFERLLSRDLRSNYLRHPRAILWHQGESDANQADPSRTLEGERYRQLLRRLIIEYHRAIGFQFPWFVAQASYHSPEDPGSEDIRAAQKALWESGIALEGPDTDALVGHFRDNDGLGIHFSKEGLQEHGRLWAEKVIPWLEKELHRRRPGTQAVKMPGQSVAGYGVNRFGYNKVPGKLSLPREELSINDRPAFVMLPSEEKRSSPQPWIFYAPTLPGYPDEAEGWMHEKFLEAGVAVAGIDVGEAYGSPLSHPAFEALYDTLATDYGFAAKPCLLGRSRGGLWVCSWAIANPDRVAGIAGIYPVFDFTSYPGLEKAAPAFGLTPEELEARADELNPIKRIQVLAEAEIPVLLLHGGSDSVVPLEANSLPFFQRYEDIEKEDFVNLITFSSEGHNFADLFFRSQELVDFAIARAKAGAEEAP